MCVCVCVCDPQLAVTSRLCDQTRMGEYHPAYVRYTHDLDTNSESDEEDNNILFFSPDMALKDRGP